MGGILSHDPAVTPTVDASLATITYANGTIAHTQIGDFGPGPGRGRSPGTTCTAAAGPTANLTGDTLLFAYGDRRGQQFETHTTLESPGSASGLRGHGGAGPRVHRLRARECAPTIGADVRAGRIATTLALTAFESIRTGQPQTVAL